MKVLKFPFSLFILTIFMILMIIYGYYSFIFPCWSFVCFFNKLNPVKMVLKHRGATLSWKWGHVCSRYWKTCCSSRRWLQSSERSRAERLFWNVRTRRLAVGKLYEVRGAGPEAADPKLWQDLTPGPRQQKQVWEEVESPLKFLERAEGLDPAPVRWAGRFRLFPAQYNCLRLQSINFCEARCKKANRGPRHGFLWAQMFEMTQQFLRNWWKTDQNIKCCRHERTDSCS